LRAGNVGLDRLDVPDPGLLVERSADAVRQRKVTIASVGVRSEKVIEANMAVFCTT
jgi:hypothetical protein